MKLTYCIYLAAAASSPVIAATIPKPCQGLCTPRMSLAKVQSIFFQNGLGPRSAGNLRIRPHKIGDDAEKAARRVEIEGHRGAKKLGVDAYHASKTPEGDNAAITMAARPAAPSSSVYRLGDDEMVWRPRKWSSYEDRHRRQPLGESDTWQGYSELLLVGLVLSFLAVILLVETLQRSMNITRFRLKFWQQPIQLPIHDVVRSPLTFDSGDKEYPFPDLRKGNKGHGYKFCRSRLTPLNMSLVHNAYPNTPTLVPSSAPEYQRIEITKEDEESESLW